MPINRASVPYLTPMAAPPANTTPSGFPYGAYMYKVFGDGSYPVAYGTLISIKTEDSNACTQIFQAWNYNSNPGGPTALYTRSNRDVNNQFGPWQRFILDDGSGGVSIDHLTSLLNVNQNIDPASYTGGFPGNAMMGWNRSGGTGEVDIISSGGSQNELLRLYSMSGTNPILYYQFFKNLIMINGVNETAIPLTSPWTNYGGVYDTAKYYRDPVGIVHLAGLVTGGASGSTIGVLPAGNRPAATKIFTTQCGPSNAICRVNIESSGNLTLSSPSGSTWVSLEGISFRQAN